MKGIALNFTARFLVIAFQMINIKLYTNYLDTEQLGIYFFLLTVSYSANALLFVPMDYYQQANLARIMSTSGGARPLLNFNGRVTGLYMIFSLCVVALCMAVKPSFVLYAVLVSLLAFALYLVQALRNTLNNLEYRNCMSMSFIQESIVKVLSFFVLVTYFEPDETLLIAAWLFALGLTSIYLFYMTAKHKVFKCVCASQIRAKDVFVFSYPFSIGAICNWLQLQGYRLVLVPLGFSEAVGVFATLSSIGSAAIGAASLIYSQQFIPQLYKTKGQYTARYLKGAVAVIFSVALVSFGVGDFIVKILTRPEFSEHWMLLLYGVATDGAILLIAAMVIHITLVGSTKKLITSSLVGVLAMVISFGLLYYADKISVFTVGVPMLFSQWLVVAYMFSIYKNTEPKPS